MRARPYAWLVCVAALAAVAACNDTPAAPSAVFELRLSPSVVPAGALSQGIVTVRTRSAHEIHIQLATSDGVATVPGSIVVPAGSASAAFTVTTRLVAVDTAVTIRATAGTATQAAALRVLSPIERPATLDALELDATVVRGGQSAQGTIRLTGSAPSPGGLTVNIRSSNAAAVVPASVAVQAGAVSATFVVSTRPVVLETQLEITAAYLDQTRTVPLRVTP
jgi:hypothetical protein